MADKVFKSPEGAPAQGPENKKESGQEQQISQTSEVLTENLAEVAEIMSEIPSENQSEGKGKVSNGSLSSAKKSQVSGVAVKPFKIPSLEIMRIQISTQINKEIKMLEKEANMMMLNPASFNPFKLNGIVSRIRDLKDILSNLAIATVETMKGWWIKFVKNNGV